MSRIVPANYILRIPQRATLEESIVLKSNGQPINLTGYTVLGSIWKDRERREKITDLDVIYTNRATGSIKLRLDRTATRAITQGGFWDLLVIEPGGDADYWLEGPAPLDIGLTDNA